MAIALRRQDDGLEVPVIRHDLYAESCVFLLGSQGIIDSLTPEQLRALGELPVGPTQEIGQSPTE